MKRTLSVAAATFLATVSIAPGQITVGKDERNPFHPATGGQPTEMAGHLDPTAQDLDLGLNTSGLAEALHVGQLEIASVPEPAAILVVLASLGLISLVGQRDRQPKHRAERRR